MGEEMWKTISGSNGKYAVSSYGRVRNEKNGRILKPALSPTGYHRVTVFKDGKRKEYSVHRLVCEAFLPNPNEYNEVNHLDSNRANNHVENLEWCTHKQNMQHAGAKGHMARDGVRFQNRKGDTRSFQEIWASLAKNEKYVLGYVLIGKGVANSAATISNWANGKNKPNKKIITRVSRLVSWALHTTCYPDTLFPAR